MFIDRCVATASCWFRSLRNMLQCNLTTELLLRKDEIHFVINNKPRVGLKENEMEEVQHNI
jgi:hypothetical protein